MSPSKKKEPLKESSENEKKTVSQKDAIRTLGSTLEKRWDQRLVQAIAEEVEQQPVFSTGNLAIDWCLGGGYPVGNYIELYGREGCGKTTEAIQTGCAAQAAGRAVAYVSFESADNLFYFQQLGLNVSDPTKFLLIKAEKKDQGEDYSPFTMEMGFDAVRTN